MLPLFLWYNHKLRNNMKHYISEIAEMTILIAYSYNVFDFLFSKQMGLESIPSVERSRRP